MTKENAPTEIKDEALDDVSGGIDINNDHMPMTGTASIDINNDHMPTTGMTSIDINNDHMPSVGRAGNWG
jgi:hypothetical protein